MYPANIKKSTKMKLASKSTKEIIRALNIKKLTQQKLGYQSPINFRKQTA
ncbi:hypothetical protein FORC49_2558 [Listeria monocytogenes]|nr:hypothetical protein LMntsn_2523 [Listeria monocytogenes]ERH81645.1 hypothetical protein O171_11475 [Listeria monocytogenes serotype 4bV str. LS645]EXL21957.1 hypothetical protein X846_2244 [Listeria monocytogenes Lm_1886]KHK32003.1 hypothetical protein I619_14287 [Listeria monocytogenes SHL010]ASL51631.1 hypothetical protein FORC49_2558 [Listeria monocytogenes]